jgi:enamine deaminase RidA (YjgF/YER057c/UK114 family)
MRVLLVLCFVAVCGCSPKESARQTEQLYTYDVEARIDSLGITLAAPALPPGVRLVTAVRTGNLVYLSGNGPLPAGDRPGYYGKVGKDITLPEGYAAARSTGISLLKVLQDEIGDLNKVVRIVKVFGMVNCEPSFTEHPQVINGFSDLMIEIFGERGKHARSAVGMTSLPWNIACEVEMIVEVKD